MSEEHNEHLRCARASMESPHVVGEPMSRAELAEQVNAWIYSNFDGYRGAPLDANYIGKLERGLIRWPQDEAKRAGLRAVLDAGRDADLGFRRPRRSPTIVALVGRRKFLGAAPGATVEATCLPSANMLRLERLRRALLDRRRDRFPSEEVSMPDLRRGIAEAHRLYQQANYDGAADLLPKLIDHLGTAEDSQSVRTGVITYLVAAKWATKVGDGALAWVAADRSLHLARQTDRHGLIGIANYQVACALLKNKHAADAEETAAEAAEQLARHTECARSDIGDIISARGALLLLLAIMKARQGDVQSARSNLRQAGQLAEQLGHDGNWLWTAFGPTNIAIHELAVHVALGDSRTALKLGEYIDVDALPSGLRGRRSQVHLELSWASVGEGHDSWAVLHLLEAERVAKQAVSRNSSARVLLSTLLTRERKSLTPGLRALAIRAGVE